jgi:hypothetical protein
MLNVEMDMHLANEAKACVANLDLEELLSRGRVRFSVFEAGSH